MTEKGGISACSPPRKREAFGHDTVVMLPLHNKYLQITMNYRVQDEHWCGDIPRKHAHCAPAAPIARVRLRNFCLTAKDQASSPPDGLLRNIPTPARPGYSARGNGKGRHSGMHHHHCHSRMFTTTVIPACSTTTVIPACFKRESTRCHAPPTKNAWMPDRITRA